jgi:hypothetical protein
MATRKTWILIIAGSLGVCVLGLVCVAGAGVYFVTHHVHTVHASDADAMREFDSVHATFHGQRALYESSDDADRPQPTRSVTDIPTAARPANLLRVLAWDPDEGRLVNVSLPFWLLRMGKRKMDVVRDDRGFDLERLNLDVDELARIGPTLVFDFRNRQGVRVVLWSE